MKKDKEIKISNKIIGSKRPVFIIAEAGVNHNGRLDLALKLVDAAAYSGADAVKFQTFKAEQVVTGVGKMANYQKKNIGKTESQLEMLRRLEFNDVWYEKIIKRCKEKKIILLSTPHGNFESVDLLQKIGVPAFKFGSGDLNNIPLLQYAAKFRKPIILGTGMANMAEVEDAVKAIKRTGNNKIILLHCTTNYPCPFNEVNLRAMQNMMKTFPDISVGYSDHTLGTQVPVMAVTLGAEVIEKHITLDNKMKGPDHKASADIRVFKKMVDKIRTVEQIMGSSEKKPVGEEIRNKRIVRKSLVALEDIKKGEKFSSRNVGIKRPGTGISPKFYSETLHKRAKRNIKADDLLKVTDIA